MEGRGGRSGSPEAAARPPKGPRAAGARPGRVKRRKTKRERDSAKFGRQNAGARRLELRRTLPPLRCCRRPAARPLSSPVAAPKPVIITQRRLSQHLGMFNREVKSVDIERLLSPRNGQESAPASPGRKDAGTETQLQVEVPAAASPAGEPSLQRLPDGQPGTEDRSGEPRPEQSVPGRPGPGPSRAKTPTPPEDKENVPPPGPERGAAGLPWREIACKLRALLGQTPAFPGRDLISERRRAILAVLLDRHRAFPDLSALLAHKTRAAEAAPRGQGARQGCRERAGAHRSARVLPRGVSPGAGSLFPRRTRARHLAPRIFAPRGFPAQVVFGLWVWLTTPRFLSLADVGSPGTPEQELLFAMGLRSSRNSEPDTYGKWRRNEDLPSACSCTPSRLPTVVNRSRFSWTLGNEEAGGIYPESPALLFSAHGERRPACRESPPGQEGLGRRVRALPHGELLPDSPPARFSLEGPGLLCRAAPGAAPCCGASSEPAWRSRTRPEKTLVGFGEDTAEGCSWSHGLPLAAGDLDLGSPSPRGLSLAGPQQYGSSRRPSAEPWASQRLDLGPGPARLQASADVLGSVWSPGAFEQAERRLSCAPGWPCSAHRAASRQLRSWHDPPRHGSCLRWPDRPLETLVPCRETREPGHGRLPAPAKHGACCWQHRGTPESCPPWDCKAWELPETGPGRSLLGPEDAERLRALRRLPMSFFPPSEALERGCSPPRPARGCLQRDSSPEGWVFPRMKLY
ncbi:proline-rich protein 19 [Struthio camelus]|uniref:proline-rich protein 19 n=1 Tax=Struthio camelus TaxID=8801 RepID=UPI003603F911